MQDFLNPQGAPRDHSRPLKKGDALWDQYFPPKKEVKKGRKNDEFILQKSEITWFRRQYPHLWRMLYMVKNDGEKKKYQSNTGVWFSPAASRDGSAGLVKGILDLEFVLSNHKYTGMHIENKTDIGTQSQEQIVFKMMATAAGRKCIVVRKLDEFIYEINDYLKTVDPLIIAEIGRLEIAYQEQSKLKAVKKLNK